MFPLYYTIHYNVLFGWIHKKIIKKFYYKGLTFDLNGCSIPLPCYSSFIFKTYELNDRILIERNLSKKNKCVIIGAGIGFIPSITSKITKNKVMIFEINKKIIKNLESNLRLNNIKYKIYPSNLLLNKKNKQNYYYSNENFLASSMFRKSKRKLKMNNVFYSSINELKKYNTLIIDGEGIEKHYIDNIEVLKNIKNIFFEFHNDIFSNNEKNILFKNLNKKGFVLEDSFINSYLFIKKK